MSRLVCQRCGKFAGAKSWKEVQTHQTCTCLSRDGLLQGGYVPPLNAPPLNAPPLRDGQTRAAEYEPKSSVPPLTEQRLREIIREELWRHDNPNRAYQRDAEQQAQLATPTAAPVPAKTPVKTHTSFDVLRRLVKRQTLWSDGTTSVETISESLVAKQ